MRILSSVLFLAVIACLSSVSTAQEIEPALDTNATANATSLLEEDDLVLNTTSIPPSDGENSTSLITFTTSPDLNTTDLIGYSNETLNNATDGDAADDHEFNLAEIPPARTQPVHPPPSEEQQLTNDTSPDQEDDQDRHDEAAGGEADREDHGQEEQRPEDDRDEEESRRRAYEEAVRAHEEAQRQQQAAEAQDHAVASEHETHDQQEHDRHEQDEHDRAAAAPVAVVAASEGLPPKQSIQATFKFTTEQRCFDFLKRLKGKGRNEHSDHPLTCPAAFDGILCWRPADPGETLLQVCPDVPRQRMSYARRECVNGQWREYPHANSKLQLRDILQSSYEECYQVPAFLRKHGSAAYQSGTSAELLGPGASEYRLPTVTPAASAVPAEHTTLVSFVQAPEVEQRTPEPTHAHVTTENSLLQNGSPLRPWFASNDKDCHEFLTQHNLANTRDGTWCSGVSDGQYCWPATAPNLTVSQPCRQRSADEDPSILIPNASRHCNADGQWAKDRSDGSSDPAGWTNKDACGGGPSEGDIAVAGVGRFFATADATTLVSVTEEPATNLPMALTSNQDSEARHAPKQPWLQSTQQACEEFLRHIARLDETQAGSCRGGTDGNLCWPTTPKDQTVTQPCPPVAGLDTSKVVSRTCSASGAWSDVAGNYTDCFSSQLKELIKCAPGMSGTATVSQTMPWIFVSFLLLTLIL